MSIGTMRCVAINVTDHDVACRFWSALTGYEVLEYRYWQRDWMVYLGTNVPRKHEIILIHTDHAPIQTTVPTHHDTNCVHIDITPNHGVDAAIVEILELGGTLKKPPSLYPRPTATSDEPPVIDWAVMQDPFGNEFCLVHELEPEQLIAAYEAARQGITDDQELRAAAGQTTLP